MSRYRLNDGTVVDTDLAVKHWKEATYSIPSMGLPLSKATRNWWSHQTLYLSRKGRFYIEQTSDIETIPEGTVIAFINNRQAVGWLIANDHEVPAELQSIANDIVE